MIPSAVSPAAHVSQATARRAVAARAALWLSMGTVILLAAFLRFYNLSTQGFMHWDEGLYALEGQFLAETWRHLLSPSIDPNWLPLGRGPAFQRPFHSLLLSLGMSFGGEAAAAALLVSAVAGTITTAVLAVLGWRLFTPATGIVGAAVFATLPLGVVYSRQALSEANGMLVLTLSVLAYSMSRTARGRGISFLVLSGLLLGLSIVTNLRLYVMPAVLVGCEMSSWLWERRQGKVQFLRRIIVLAYAAISVLCAATLSLWWLRDYYQRIGVPPQWPVIAYEDQLGFFWNMQNSYARPFYGGLDPLYYPFVLWNFAGAAVVACAGVFLVLRLARLRVNSSGDILLAIWLLLPFIFFFMLSDKAPRFISIILPALSLAAGRGAIEAGQLAGRYLKAPSAPGLAACALAAAMLYTGISWSWDFVQRASGYPGATQFALDHGARGVIAGQPLPVEFFSRQSIMTAAIPDEPDLLLNGHRLGYRYLIVDDHAYVNVGSRALAADVERVVKPEAVFADSLKDGPLFFLEYSEFLKIDLRSTMDLYRHIREVRGQSEVRVYDLRQYLAESGRLPR